MGLAAIDLFVGAAERTKPLEGLDQPERQAGLGAARALADEAVHAALRQLSRSLGYGFVTQDAAVFNGDARWSSADPLQSSRFQNECAGEPAVGELVIAHSFLNATRSMCPSSRATFAALLCTVGRPWLYGA